MGELFAVEKASAVSAKTMLNALEITGTSSSATSNNISALAYRIDLALAALGRLGQVEADMAAKRIAAEDNAKPTPHDLEF